MEMAGGFGRLRYRARPGSGDDRSRWRCPRSGDHFSGIVEIVGSIPSRSTSFLKSLPAAPARLGVSSRMTSGLALSPPMFPPGASCERLELGRPLQRLHSQGSSPCAPNTTFKGLGLDLRENKKATARLFQSWPLGFYSRCSGFVANRSSRPKGLWRRRLPGRSRRPAIAPRPDRARAREGRVTAAPDGRKRLHCPLVKSCHRVARIALVARGRRAPRLHS